MLVSTGSQAYDATLWDVVPFYDEKRTSNAGNLSLTPFCLSQPRAVCFPFVIRTDIKDRESFFLFSPVTTVSQQRPQVRFALPVATNLCGPSPTLPSVAGLKPLLTGATEYSGVMLAPLALFAE